MLEKYSEGTCAYQKKRKEKKEKLLWKHIRQIIQILSYFLDFMFAELSNFLKLKICYELFSHIN